jgi:predicted glycoside hydrolase/deacetylase ChbG (UPF0249 family)
MAEKKYLIVNADDFGQSRGINRGIIEAHEHGIVTSASLMVRWPAAAEAVAYSRNRPELSLGIHIDLGEWKYQEGSWTPLYKVVRMDDADAIANEVSKQLSLFRALVGNEPTHIDSHQHVHLREPARTVLLTMSRYLGIPLRHLGSVVRYCGDFYGQNDDGSSLSQLISVDHLIRLLTHLSANVTELGCHPGDASDLDTMYRHERELELRALCDSKVRAAIPSLGLELCSFNTDTVRQLTANDKAGVDC